MCTPNVNRHSNSCLWQRVLPMKIDTVIHVCGNAGQQKLSSIPSLKHIKNPTLSVFYFQNVNGNIQWNRYNAYPSYHQSLYTNIHVDVKIQ